MNLADPVYGCIMWMVTCIFSSIFAELMLTIRIFICTDWEVSVQALEVLASEVAGLLDVLYSSEEKDKVLPLLTQLMTHVTPYLRNHTLVAVLYCV